MNIIKNVSMWVQGFFKIYGHLWIYARKENKRYWNTVYRQRAMDMRKEELKDKKI